jgi:hypothetical protein
MGAAENHPFDHLPPGPANHFKLVFYRAVLRLLTYLRRHHGSFEKVVEQFPFLAGYNNELAEFGLEGLFFEEAEAQWDKWLREWEARAVEHLPLRALREAADLDHAALALFLSIGLVEEDDRFAAVFDSLQGAHDHSRPSEGLLQALWSDLHGLCEARATLRHLGELGLIQIMNADAPRSARSLQVPGLLWETLRGEYRERPAPWLRCRHPGHLVAVEELILPEAVRAALTTLLTLLHSGEVKTLVVRGPWRNGRRTLLGAVARQLNLGVLEITGLSKPEDERWQLIGPLAMARRALPVVVLDLAPGESADVPALNGYRGPLGIVVGRQGGLRGPGAERGLALTLDIPDADLRRLHWIAALGAHAVADLDQISERMRMTGGNIRRAAKVAPSYAALAKRSAITLADVRQASHALGREMLETLAAHVPVGGDWSHLAVGADTLSELYTLENRCRHREQLRAAAGPVLEGQLNVGVRALFSGPSGTGKTLAARLLASVLQMDLYRLDLSAVVNKYIGETEKNLSQIFARAEELNVILLLDEGDALLTQRTGVQTANDRYANLETNYLLQRIESFSGILLVTTNAAEHIDSAFQRRMDVVIDFRPPDVAERWLIWKLHLPPTHAIPAPLLDEVADRCALSGGQIRNAVLHASLLALGNGGTITSEYFATAVQREYRKSGAACPLRRSASDRFGAV